VLDEADTLLDMGFRDDIEAISSALPPSPERQTLLFSATVSRAVEQIARATLAKNYEYINCVSADDSPVHAHVTQYHTIVPSADQQIPHLLRLLTHDQLTNPAKSKVIVFFPTTRMVQLFATLLRELAPTALPGGRRTSIYEIHSKRTQEARTNTSDRFRGDKSGASILVTSDVSARGVDYPGVSRVIQVGIPQSTDQYIHRVGRTGRGGAIGGRGDIVLLPWEMGFVTWQLNHVPLKPLTTESLKEQVATLTEKFDNDPKAFFKDTPATEQVAVDRRGRQDYSVPQIYQAPFAPKLQEQETSIRNLLTQADDEAIKETMASMLGYYLTKGPEMRVQKPIIVEGLKQWTVEACGLPTPPYISQAFLQRLGVSDNRTKHFGSAPRPPRERRSDAAPWSGRGAVSHRMLPQSTESGSKSWDLEEGDPRTPPEEYRTPRYGKTFTRKPGGSSGGYGDRNSGGGGGGYNRGGGDRGGERPAWGNSRGGGGGGSGGGRIRDSDW
jgi:ATP-dependent RNA helicase MSS116